MTDYLKQLERLKRHYIQSIGHYDSISFLDLAHALRVWTEVKNGIEAVYNKAVFKKGIVTNKLKTIFRNAEFAYAFLPEGITTSAIATGEAEGREIVSGPNIEQFTWGGLVKIEANRDLTLAQFFLIYRSLSNEELSLLFNESKNIPITKVSFSKYMDSPAAYFEFFGNQPKQISNEELIKRIANEYEASHADVHDTGFVLNNCFSEPIKRLMDYRYARLPLPYFILLHIAKSIIDGLDGHV